MASTYPGCLSASQTFLGARVAMDGMEEGDTIWIVEIAFCAEVSTVGEDNRSVDHHLRFYQFEQGDHFNHYQIDQLDHLDYLDHFDQVEH
ncbi:hypothetical protein Tco_1435619 [Tanacetum coccineum]